MNHLSPLFLLRLLRRRLGLLRFSENIDTVGDGAIVAVVAREELVRPGVSGLFVRTRVVSETSSPQLDIESRTTVNCTVHSAQFMNSPMFLSADEPVGVEAPVLGPLLAFLFGMNSSSSRPSESTSYPTDSPR